MARSTSSSSAQRSTRTNAGRQLLPREERQAQLLGAAATAFARAGFAATSMEDVAAEAGITKLIVYRHFSSKEELYRAALARVTDRLREEFLLGFSQPAPERSGFICRSMLIVARENPDGFRLLTVHAAREPNFAAAEQEFRANGRAVADTMIADMIPDPTIKAWAGQMIVDYLIDGVLTWLELGDPARDEEFIDLATRGWQGMFQAWADPDKVPPHLRAVLARRADEEG